MSTRRIYLDNNATSPLKPEVREAMIRCWESSWANPSSQHRDGQSARSVLESARESLADALGAGLDDRLVFTSGGTESNHLAILGLAGDPPGRILVSAVEHPSVHGAMQILTERGFQVEYIPVESQGRVSVDQVSKKVTAGARLLSLMFANHETGVIQPIKELAAICRRHGTIFHCDGVQAVGKVPISFGDLGIDALSLAAHKLHGPIGIGALLIRHGVLLRPQFIGGFQQWGLRPGTEFTPLAVGFATAVGLMASQPQTTSFLSSLRDRFESRLAEELPIVVLGQSVDRVPQTSCVSFPGMDRQQLLLALDLAGISCSTGSACASGSSEPSPVLLAMGLSESLIRGALRFSFGMQNGQVDIDDSIQRILHTYKCLQQACGRENLSLGPPHCAVDSV